MFETSEKVEQSSYWVWVGGIPAIFKLNELLLFEISFPVVILALDRMRPIAGL